MNPGTIGETDWVDIAALSPPPAGIGLGLLLTLLVAGVVGVVILYSLYRHSRIGLALRMQWLERRAHRQASRAIAAQLEQMLPRVYRDTTQAPEFYAQLQRLRFSAAEPQTAQLCELIQQARKLIRTRRP